MKKNNKGVNFNLARLIKMAGAGSFISYNRGEGVYNERCPPMERAHVFKKCSKGLQRTLLTIMGTSSLAALLKLRVSSRLAMTDGFVIALEFCEWNGEP